ncbi:MarR family winged helix-turn-helix transcriptional regulator [Pseudoxanthomonas sacheonensis]|uniref:MarR family winged helix-turn-helix transcriptional regulator n=1 Tax=Pseudoxanthomonas sacheonensis TaxID=443615 RepID=UPI0013D37932|nr:MarR family winged helix-turn-helix transcriptional regulator [Pseudoxanthomonas sacheonensis]KAF1706721.1 MarR family transcriptional regulator [Pseudoxanthomonas sacheonensis]
MPSPSESVCTCFRLRRAARQVSQIYDRELAAVGLSLNEYSILRHTERGGHCLLGELADSLGMERTTLTRNLKPLLEAGWLKEARGEDARQRLISVTASGRKRIANAKPHWLRAQRRIEASYGIARTDRLRADLDLLDIALRHESGIAA